MRLVGGLVGWCIVALVSGCGGADVVFAQEQTFTGSEWAYADSVSFNFTVEDTSSRYDLVLTVDHGTDFAYQNFYVNVNTHLPGGQVLQQPLSLELADNFGEWYGDCGGGECNIAIALQRGTRFTDEGDYRLVVAQYSRQDVLADIDGIGFQLVKVEGFQPE